MPKPKTPDYTRRAIKAYDSKYDKIAIRLPKGTADEIRTRTGKSLNQYFIDLYTEDLKRHHETTAPPDNTPEEVKKPRTKKNTTLKS